MNEKNRNSITPFEKDSIKWYSDLVLKSELILYGPTKGTMYLRPYAVSIWKLITEKITIEFEKLGILEVKFPLIFPEKLLEKEKNHISGFAPEVYRITHVGQKRLSEVNIIRPTSEMLFEDYFKQTIKSYKDLPVKLNQWVNIMRYENNTRPFLRNSEFYWQEGHTVHSTSEEAKSFAIKIHNVYNEFLSKALLLPILNGEKSSIERFAGAKNSYTSETILKDGQALQTGTSHYLDQNFAKALDFKIQTSENKYDYPFQTSWGVSTRMIGAIIMSHSDNSGLVLPSEIAPIQILFIPVFYSESKINDEIFKFLKEIIKKIPKEFRFKIDDDKNLSFGNRFYNSQFKGIPISLIIGKDESKNQIITYKLRTQNLKKEIKIKELNSSFFKNLIKENDDKIKNLGQKNLEDKIMWISNLKEISKNIKDKKIVYCYWTEDSKLEKKIKGETGATLRLIFDSKESKKSVNQNIETNKVAIFARAY